MESFTSQRNGFRILHNREKFGERQEIESFRNIITRNEVIGFGEKFLDPVIEN
jgi:hypothetical protein